MTARHSFLMRTIDHMIKAVKRCSQKRNAHNRLDNHCLNQEFLMAWAMAVTIMQASADSSNSMLPASNIVGSTAPSRVGGGNLSLGATLAGDAATQSGAATALVKQELG